MSRLHYADLKGTIGSGGLTSSATSHTFTAPLTYANGVTVPTLTGSDSFLLSILDSSGNLSEVVNVTAYNSSTGAATLVRGQEGTSGVSHSSGDKVTNSVYASDLPAGDVDNAAAFAAAYGTLQISDEFEATSTSLPSAYSWVNQGGATYDEKLGTGVIVGTNQSGDQGRCIFRSLSGLTSTWTAVAKAVVGISDSNSNYTYAGMMLRESSSGKCYTYRLGNDSTLALETWPAASGANASLGAVAPTHRLPVYFKIVKGASTTSFYYSRDGRAWRSFATGVSLSYCTPDQIGFFTGCNGGGDNQISIHWLRIY